MYRLQVKLKQHTPLIHFQWNQKGATLRASELKPKLDKFIIQRSFNNDFESCKCFLVGYDRRCQEKIRRKFEEEGFRALNYKVRVEPQGEKQEIKDDASLKMYFANIGNDAEKYGVMYSDGVCLQFESIFDSVIQLLKEHLAAFLMVTNFGARQSKGYGSFYIDTDVHKGKPLNVAVNLRYRFNLEGDLGYVFTTLNDFYAVLRSGINDQKGLYIKSALFKYLKDQLHEQWDKKTIKQHFLTEREKILEREAHPESEAIEYETGISEPPEQEKSFSLKGRTIECPLDNSHYLTKELLGLSTIEKWKVKTDNNGGFASFKLTRESDEIERFQSPLFFKLIKNEEGYTIYFEPRPIPEQMTNQLFLIEGEGRGKFAIRTRSAFDIQDYLNYVFSSVSLAGLCCKKEGREANEKYSTLENIFNQLRNNL